MPAAQETIDSTTESESKNVIKAADRVRAEAKTSSGRDTVETDPIFTEKQWSQVLICVGVTILCVVVKMFLQSPLFAKSRKLVGMPAMGMDD
ncbi:hypothetical protein BCR33DRAFT_717193 [Rhizoclosmatium globosum]|uniref:Uncharacterized protein n=1 Tax=Rhizoclosmatium globosum TaxID=329046 RepID=A0A1Y2CAZ4_9FUNG|nr:hypothetical protein BCR33DRAFT_717193 [Rhizoclosmatium globosum]|eukprot:ORY44106.1 hypothetical protein BCR33DRAFT_717193 [Rhizoclosmatium globosum]